MKKSNKASFKLICSLLAASTVSISMQAEERDDTDGLTPVRQQLLRSFDMHEKKTLTFFENLMTLKMPEENNLQSKGNLKIKVSDTAKNESSFDLNFESKSTFDANYIGKEIDIDQRKSIKDKTYLRFFGDLEEIIAVINEGKLTLAQPSLSTYTLVDFKLERDKLGSSNQIEQTILNLIPSDIKSKFLEVEDVNSYSPQPISMKESQVNPFGKLNDIFLKIRQEIKNNKNGDDFEFLKPVEIDGDICNVVSNAESLSKENDKKVRFYLSKKTGLVRRIGVADPGGKKCLEVFLNMIAVIH